MSRLTDAHGNNPFAPPGGDSGLSSDGKVLYPEGMHGAEVYATFWQRAGGHIVDHVLFGMIGGISVIVYFWTFVILFGEVHLMPDGSIPYHDQEKFDYFIQGMFLFCGIMAFSYSALSECSRFQATPGKFLFGLKVTDLSGNRISFVRSSGRFFSKYFSQFFYMGYLIQPFTEYKQTLHDMMAGTLVVKR